jgi:hypothetical protein
MQILLLLASCYQHVQEHEQTSEQRFVGNFNVWTRHRIPGKMRLLLLQIYSEALCATEVQIYCLPLTKICNTMLDAPVNAI